MVALLFMKSCASTKNMTPEDFETIRKSKVRKVEGNLRAYGPNTILCGDDFILKPSIGYRRWGNGRYEKGLFQVAL
jgi:hypothetical protein